MDILPAYFRGAKLQIISENSKPAEGEILI